MLEKRLCPVKETVVYISTCEKKCSYSREKCDEVRARREAERRHCIECKDNENKNVCDPCIDADPRNRPNWKPGKAKETKPAKLETRKPEQLSLF